MKSKFIDTWKFASGFFHHEKMVNSLKLIIERRFYLLYKMKEEQKTLKQFNTELSI